MKIGPEKCNKNKNVYLLCLKHVPKGGVEGAFAPHNNF